MSRNESMWQRNAEEAEELEDAFHRALEDGVITPQEKTNLLLGVRRNVQRHDESLQVVLLSTSYLNGGEQARTNYHSQIQKRERVNRSAGYRTLADMEVSGKQTAG